VCAVSFATKVNAASAPRFGPVAGDVWRCTPSSKGTLVPSASSTGQGALLRASWRSPGTPGEFRLELASSGEMPVSGKKAAGKPKEAKTGVKQTESRRWRPPTNSNVLRDKKSAS